MFPNHQKIGGAPLNVAFRLHAFGNEVSMISSVGNDELGKKLLEYIADNGLNTDSIKNNKFSFKTDKVQVTLNDKDSASYNINFPSAWDYILLNCAKYKVFDLNLRPPYYTKQILIDLMNKANFIKFNDKELYELVYIMS